MPKVPPVVLILAYALVAALPLALSWMLGGPPRAIHQELASGLGILAFSMTLLEFILSGRFRRISQRLGMDVTMRAHQLLARTALVFALLHPFLYGGSPAGGPRPWDPTRQLTLTTDFGSLSSGIAAFVLLFGLVYLAIGRKHLDYSYETWRLMHGLGALLIAGLLLHHTIHAGRYGSHPVMTWVWIGMTGVAIASLLYVYLVVPLRDGRCVWRVTQVTRLTPRQWCVTVEPHGHAGLPYLAGQFVWLNIGHSPFSLKEHPFSICSAPAHGPQVSFMIKELGDFTRTIGQIEPGTRAYLDGPFGSLSVEGRTEPGLALIAGGVGIAPLLSILRQLRATSDSRRVKILYGNRREDQIAWREELDREDTTYVLSEPPADWAGESGRINPALLDRSFTPDQFGTWLFVLCGPARMMETIEEHLIARGTPSHRILSERFDYD
jgi:predicted ferric reductase